VLDEVRAFARRRPGAYLAIAAGAGLLTGRLARGLAASDDDAGRTTTRPEQDSRTPGLGNGSPSRTAQPLGAGAVAPGFPAPGPSPAASESGWDPVRPTTPAEPSGTVRRDG
jgi:hypothetical protein